MTIELNKKFLTIEQAYIKKMISKESESLWGKQGYWKIFIGGKGFRFDFAPLFLDGNILLSHLDGMSFIDEKESWLTSHEATCEHEDLDFYGLVKTVTVTFSQYSLSNKSILANINGRLDPDELELPSLIDFSFVGKLIFAGIHFFGYSQEEIKEKTRDIAEHIAREESISDSNSIVFFEKP